MTWGLRLGFRESNRLRWYLALRRAFAVVWLVAALSPIAPRGFAAEAKPLLMLGDKNYPPVSFLRDGIAKGIDVDLAKALAKPLNREVVVQLMDWNVAQEKLLRGEADALIGMSITSDRMTRFDFANPTFAREFSFVVRSGDLTVRNTKDLEGKSVGVTSGGFPHAFLESFGAVDLVLVKDYGDGFARLKAREIDIMAADSWVAAYLMERNRVKGLALVETPFAVTPRAIAVKKGNAALRSEINEALNTLKAERQIEEIENRWKAQEMLFFSRARIRNFFLVASGVAMVLLLGAMAAWVLTLKKQIRIRRIAESALRNSEQRLQTLADASFEGIGVCQDGILIDANEQLVRMLQYDRSELIGKPVISLAAPECRAAVARKTAQDVTEPFEYQAIRKNGTLFAVEVCGRTISTTPHHIRVTAVRDISERKQAEERLQLLQAITMDVATVGDLASALEIILRRVCDKTGWVLGQAWMPNADGTTLSCCPAFFAAAPGIDRFRQISTESIFDPGTGLPGRVLQSKSSHWIRDVTQDLRFPRAEVAREAGIKAGLGVPILAGDEVIAVLEFFLREPREEDERLVEVIATVGRQIGLVMERKRAEEALRKSEERFSRFFALAPAAMAVTLPWEGGMILDINREFTRLLGYTHEEAVGQTTVGLNLFLDTGMRAGLLERLETGALKEHELVLRAKNGEPIVGRYSGHVLQVEGQRVVLSAFVDIRQSKRAEEQLRNSGEQLRALAGRLQAVREEERTRIAREIHDVLAQELTRLKIDLGWLGKRLRKGTLEGAPAGDPAAILEKVNTLNQLTDATISTVQKIAAELRPVVLDSLGLSAAIEWQAEEFQSRTGIHCEAIVPEEEIPLTREGATGLFRIVQESLTNIVRHANATHVEIILEIENDQLRLEVHDNGKGFDRNEMKDPHSLGLLGMHERALLLDGKFEIQGTPGKGTRIIVSLPLTMSGRVDSESTTGTSRALT